MANINKERGNYFGWHPTKDKFFYTSDDMGFFEENHAANHAGNLKDKKVEAITRTEYEAWKGGNVKEVLADAELELKNATEDLAVKQAAADGLKTTTAAKVKAPVMKALNAAKERLANAEQSLAVAKEAEGIEVIA